MGSERVLAGDSTTVSSSVSRRGVLAGALGAALAVPRSRRSLAQNQGDAAIRVFPAHGSLTASPGTQITFRGESLSRLSPVRVTGSVSGEHSGIEVAHSDGGGISWFPDVAFQPGETVTVDTRLEVAGGDEGAFSFSCVQPRVVKMTPADNPADEGIEVDAEASSVRFRSRPGLVPPRIVTESYGGETGSGYLFLSPKGGAGTDGAMIVDDTGGLVWYFPAVVSTERIYDFRVMEYQGEPALVWWQGIAYAGHGFGHWVILDRTYKQIGSIQVGNGYAGGDMHDILLTPRGTAIVGAYNVIAWDLTEVGGSTDGSVIDNVVQEIDIASGAVIFEWHSLDHVAITEAYTEVNPERPNANFDYFHYNSFAFDADGDIIVSARNTWASYKVDRLTGEVHWRLGGKASDFEMGEGTQPAWQHDVRPAGHGELTIFDNGAAPPIHDESRGIVVALDTEAMSATLTREYTHPEPVLADSQGNVQILPNGNVLVGWGGAPLATEFAADGTLVLDIRLPADKESYRVFRFEWDGQPSDEPELAVEPGPDGALVFATWNGATAIASWLVLTGEAEDAMAPVSRRRSPSPPPGATSRSRRWAPPDRCSGDRAPSPSPHSRPPSDAVRSSRRRDEVVLLPEEPARAQPAPVGDPVGQRPDRRDPASPRPRLGRPERLLNQPHRGDLPHQLCLLHRAVVEHP